jgi:hypothetical protein
LDEPFVRALKRAAGLAAATIALALLAAWQIPPRMDWDRYRGALADFASSRMGRTVTIGGQVRLMLLPDPVLVADRVTLADRGDGVSATIGALRLRIALADLLHGRLVPHRLELDDPVVTLPWPLPRGAAQAVPTGVEGGFTASVEGGALRLGGVTLTGINAGVQTDPDTGAFAAQGAARLGGLPCRFTALIGAPGRDGVSTLTTTVDGQDAAQGAGGSLRGRVLGSGVQGQLTLRGPNLGKLLPGPALPWRLEGYVTAAQGQVQAQHLDLLLGASPGTGSATLLLGAAPRLAVTAHFGQVALDGWGWRALATPPALPVRLDLSSTAAGLMGGTLHDAQAVVSLGEASAGIAAHAVLPGGATLHLDGRAARSGGEGFAGVFKIAAPDLPALLEWLRPLLPAVLAALPAVPATGDLAGTVAWAPGQASLSQLSGHAGGGSVAGHVSLSFAKRPSIAATLSVDRLQLPAPAMHGFWQATRAWPGAPAAPFAAFDAALDISAASASVGGLAASHLVLQGNGGQAGFQLNRLAADLPGAHLEAVGEFDSGGGMRDVRVDLGATDAAAFKLPGKLPPGLWQGPLHLALTASGQPNAITGQLRGDLGDLRAEAEAVLDSTAPRLTATVTLRHPGAPRLLAQAGIDGAYAWLGQGSVAFLAHLAAAPGQVAASDFSLGAGALRMNGKLGFDFSGKPPALTGSVDAAVLTLPPLPGRDETLPFGVLKGWQGQIVCTAQQVSAGKVLLATQASAVVTVADGDALVDGINATIAGGHFSGQTAVDATLDLPRFALSGTLDGATVDTLPALPGLELSGGTLDIDGDITAAGNSPGALLATLAGTAHGTLHGTALRDTDLPALTRLLTVRGPHLRTALVDALSSGDTGPLDGGFDAALDSGELTIQGATLSGHAGSVTITGGIDLPGRAPDLLVRAMPAVPHGPGLTVRVLAGRRVADVQAGLLWAGGGGLKRKRGP